MSAFGADLLLLATQRMRRIAPQQPLLTQFQNGVALRRVSSSPPDGSYLVRPTSNSAGPKYHGCENWRRSDGNSHAADGGAGTSLYASCRPQWGSLAGAELAAAVTAAGGLGVIGGGYGDADWLDREFAAAGNARVGCGFITWSLAKQPELLAGTLAHAPAVLMLSFGDPAPFAPAIRAAGSRLSCQVQTIAHARGHSYRGAEIVVAQGSEAGGHGATRATLTLVPQEVTC